jgi:hypothetical protein
MKIFAPAVAVGATVFAFAVSVHATCGVRVIPEIGTGETSWLNEALLLQRRFAVQWAMSNCADVEVRVERNGAGAWMAFAERGGGIAKRHLANARELEPAVRALFVRVDNDYFSDDAPAPAEEPEVVPPSDKGNRLSYALAGSLGMRVGLADGTAIRTPVLAGSASFLGRGWELGITGQWEGSYRQAVEDQEPDWRASALAFGVVAGRRFPLRSWDIAAGLTLSAAIVHGLSDDEMPHTEGSGADGRVGAYVGFIGSRTAIIRFRCVIGVDFVPRRAGVSHISAAAPANLPWWMGTFSIGVEAAP